MAALDMDEGNHAELQPRPRPRRPLLHPIASAQAATSSTGGKTSGQRNEATIRLPDTFPLSKEIDNARRIPPTPPFSPPIAKTAVQRRTTYQGHNSDLGSDNDNRAESENNELPRPSPSSVVHTPVKPLPPAHIVCPLLCSFDILPPPSQLPIFLTGPNRGIMFSIIVFFCLER